jgi:hypothetical protein
MLDDGKSVLCFDLLSLKGSKGFVDIVPVVNALLEACKDLKVVLNVIIQRGEYVTQLALSGPSSNLTHCGRLAKALLTAELGGDVEARETPCNSRPLW